MKKLSILIVLWFSFHVKAQKTDVLHESGYKHDYVVSTARMLEDISDTIKCIYIATLRIYGPHNNGLAGEALTLLKIKAKELGANVYHVLSYSETENEADIRVRLLFAGTKYIDANNAKRKLNSIYIFTPHRGKNDTASVYVNGAKVNFDQKKFLKIEHEADSAYKLQVSEKSLLKLNIIRKKAREATFVVLPGGKYQPGAVVVPMTAAGVAAGAGLAIYFTFKNNKPTTINYDVGRFLAEIYK